MIFESEFSVYLDTKFDLDQMFKWRNNRQVYRWCRQTTLRRYDEHLDWFNSLKCDQKNKMFSIRIDGSSSIIGICGLTNIDYIARHAEFSLYIGPEYQGNGYAGQALFILLKHGFNEFNFNKIWGETFDGNPAQNLFRKLKMKESSGHMQHYFKDGMYIDTKFFYMFSNFFNENDYEIKLGVK